MFIEMLNKDSDGNKMIYSQEETSMSEIIRPGQRQKDTMWR